jgi:ribosomal protein L11 methyltransferase
LADGRDWAALIVRADTIDSTIDDDVAAIVDDCSPLAIEELTPLPLPPGGLWDPTFPPPPEPPPAPLHWRIFFTSAIERDRAAAVLRSTYPTFEIAVVDVNDEDWAARSQRELVAVRAGRFVVAPPWDIPPPDPNLTVIVIEPSRGFGTGHHQSTRLCLRAMSDLDVRGKCVLDLGTGSGVLAMAAALSGASQVLAIDVDPDAIESARESQALNPGAARVEWLVADFRDRGAYPQIDGAWDVVLANLTGGMLRSSAVRLRELIAPTGLLVTSGFDVNERPAVEQALQLTGQAALVEDGWVGLVVRNT